MMKIIVSHSPKLIIAAWAETLFICEVEKTTLSKWDTKRKTDRRTKEEASNRTEYFLHQRRRVWFPDYFLFHYGFSASWHTAVSRHKSVQQQETWTHQGLKNTTSTNASTTTDTRLLILLRLLILPLILLILYYNYFYYYWYKYW